MKNKFLLHNNWKFSLKKTKEKIPFELKNILKENRWLKATVPGTIQTDLLNHKLIPEPFYSDNENKLQWIGKQNWVYKTSFDFPENIVTSKKLYLVMDGIDTSATILFNGAILGVVENMFCSYKFDITKNTLPKNNELEIIFTSPEIYAKQLEAKHGKLPVALRSERVYIRKAQYSFGWDWGPSFLTQGIWKNIYILQNDEYSIENYSIETLSIYENENRAKIKIKVKLNKVCSSALLLNIIIRDSNSIYEFSEKFSDSDLFEKDYELEHIKLWWPNGYGIPNLYNLHFQLSEDGVIFDEINKKFGIRTAKLILKENGNNTFHFKINGHHIFAKGANWIPGDSFLTRVTADKYEKLLSLAKAANMNILRVWGGGIYENDIFYDMCDEMGLMVWQDFMFACASYPEHKEFLDNVSEEIRQNSSRLKNHPCLVIWCGNNENEWIWHRTFNKPIKEMSGYKIYNEVIPEILNEIDPGRSYWQSTPFSEDEDPNSQTSGNRHQWDLWSNWVDYNHVNKDESLFVTEFGFQAPANLETFDKVLPKNERSFNSKIFEFHNKQVEGPERLIKFLYTHLPVNIKLADFIYLTQLNQGIALKKCVEHWQSRFPDTSGSIIWQINDVWPVTSWSLIDSNIIPKMSYYFVKNAFNSQIILFEDKLNNIYIAIQNNSFSGYSGKIDVQIVSIPKGKVQNLISKKIILEPQEKRSVYFVKSNPTNSKEKSVIIVSLINNDGTLAQQNYFLNEEWKYLKLPKTKLKYKILDERIIEVTSNKPAFFVNLESSGVTFSMNGFCLLPGKSFRLEYYQNNNKKIKNINLTCLNEYLC